MRADLLVRISSDVLPGSCLDAAYLFAQTVDNEESLFEAAVTILHQGLARRIFFSASEPRNGYPGFANWLQGLRARGVGEDQLMGVPSADLDNLNTLSEAQCMMRCTKQQGINSLLIVAPSFHLPRAFLSTLSAAYEFHRGCLIYAFPGKTLDWDEPVTHSQGILQDTRFGLISSELAKIEQYRQKGDLLADDVLLNYLQTRDALTRAQAGGLAFRN